MSPLQTFLEDLYNRYHALDEGNVASYIPELAKADPNWFGVSVATTDGQVFEVGDVQQKFTIQHRFSWNAKQPKIISPGFVLQTHYRFFTG